MKKRVDLSYYGLFVATVALLIIGLLMILSASSAWAYAYTKDIYFYFKRQLVGATLGLIALFMLSRFNYQRWRQLSLLLMVLSNALLVLVLVPGIGKSAGGATRWLGIGPFQFQPSELVKLALILYGAHVLTQRRAMTGWGRFSPLLFFAAISVGLVIAQRDLSTALVLGAIIMFLLFVGGMRLSTWFALIGLGSATTFLLVFMESYRWQRVIAFLNPWAYARKAGYQIVQALYAFGSGGLFGVGLGQSRQKFFYLPAAHTDFIFAIVGEETGLIGTALILILFLLLAYFALRVSLRSRDYYGKILAAGIGFWIVGQALVNMAVVTSTIPVTGLPLPLISYGGSSLVFTLAALGILINISSNLGRKVESSSNRRRDRRSSLSRSVHIRSVKERSSGR